MSDELLCACGHSQFVHTPCCVSPCGCDGFQAGTRYDDADEIDRLRAENMRLKAELSAKMTRAARMFDGVAAECEVFDRLCDRWPHISHITHDYYDCSLEVYFTPETPPDFALTNDDARIIYEFGFDGAYLNFADGTEQVISTRRGACPRLKVDHSKWHAETAEREHREQRLKAELERVRTVLGRLAKRYADIVNSEFQTTNDPNPLLDDEPYKAAMEIIESR